MMRSEKVSVALIALMGFVMAACSGVKGSSTTGTGSTAYSIGGSVSNLVGSGLVLADNTADTLTITGTGTVPFTFKVQTTSYNVTVVTQPTNPAQTCTVTGAQGTASANVTTVDVTCTTNSVTATIGGTLSGLATGASVILQDNGGDSLTLTANGPFTFKTPVTGPTDAYAVTVNTQPTTPNQICSVTNGSGTASANVTNVAVSCVLAYTIGGTITGLVGSGFVLQDQDGNILEDLPVTAGTGNEAFSFKDVVPTGSTYTVTINTQPTNPAQTCVIGPGTGTGTATANVTSVVVTCAAVTYSVGGNVVGLQGISPGNGPLTDGSFVLQNVLGNTLIVTENGPFTFATPEALNDQYEVSVLHAASTQFQGCTLWDYKGVVTQNVTGIIVDCAHNDWTWIDGTKTAGTVPPGTPVYGLFPSTAPSSIPNPLTNTPGARYGAAGWTDKGGNLWMFGGNGWELTGKSPGAPDTLNAPMNDLWVCAMIGVDYCEWQLVGAYNTTYGTGIYANAQHEGQSGVYTNLGSTYSVPTPVPGGRLGMATWTDNNGDLWLFGGSDGTEFLNDLWEFNASSFSPYTVTAYTTNTGQWTVEGGSGTTNQPGNYTSGTLTPGARTNAVSWTDNSGNFWLFGGYGYDGESPAVLGYLNDLWEYTGGHWVWVSGGKTDQANQNGIYGTRGTATSTNMPGGRQEAVGWVDAIGNLWLFGGEGEDSVGTTNGILNDLWMYNISSKEWTWVTGSNTANQTGVYEAQPVVGPVNTTGAAGTCGLTLGSSVLNCAVISTTGAVPGSRWGASAWIDGSGDLWLFGGWGLDSTATNGNGALNDLWVYVPNSTAGQPGTWTWVKGSNTGGQNGVYGDMLQPYKTYEIWTPGGRSNATHWVDSLGQLWLFGGEGYDSTSTTGNGYLNDMWRYVPYPD
jgi:Galactose oxidase, central domain/Kelch motif